MIGLRNTLTLTRGAPLLELGGVFQHSQTQIRLSKISIIRALFERSFSSSQQVQSEKIPDGPKERSHQSSQTIFVTGPVQGGVNIPGRDGDYYQNPNIVINPAGPNKALSGDPATINPQPSEEKEEKSDPEAAPKKSTIWEVTVGLGDRSGYTGGHHPNKT